MQGASQASLYNDIDEYTQEFLSAPAGGVICLLSVFLWILTCAREFNSLSLFFLGVWTSNDDSESIWESSYKKSFVQILENPVGWMYGEARQQNYQIFLTPSRALSLTFFVLLPRAVILIALGIFGVLFLVQTLQLTELILNAVALDVVMNVDELLFDLFSPAAVKRLVCKTRPLRVPRSKGLGKRVEHWCKLVVASICLTAVGWGLLAPMIKTMNDVKAVMCDGDLNFLAVQLPFGPVVAAQPSAIEVERGSYRYRAIFQKTRLVGGLDRQSLLYLEDGHYQLAAQFQVVQIKSWRDRSVKDVAELPATDAQFALCMDNAYTFFYPLATVAMMSGVGSIIGNESMQSCDDVAHLCYSDTSRAGKTARLICPNTCGMPLASGSAVEPVARSGLFLDTTGDGIPNECRQWFAKALFETSISCADLSLGDLLQGSEWKHYADGFSAYWSPFFRQISTVNNTLNQSHFSVLRNFMWAGMSTFGCSFFSAAVQFPSLGTGLATVSTKINFCDPKEPALDGRRSIRPFCPLTCRCPTTKKFYVGVIRNQGLYAVGDSQCPRRCFI